MLGITLQQTRVYREIKEEGREEGLEQGLKQGKIGEAVNLVTRLLTKKFGQISPENCSFISGLSLPVLEDLSEALLDFHHLDDLQIWLDNVKIPNNAID